jgi:hypothetical protein
LVARSTTHAMPRGESLKLPILLIIECGNVVPPHLLYDPTIDMGSSQWLWVGMMCRHRSILNFLGSSQYDSCYATGESLKLPILLIIECGNVVPPHLLYDPTIDMGSSQWFWVGMMCRHRSILNFLGSSQYDSCYATGRKLKTPYPTNY